MITDENQAQEFSLQTGSRLHFGLFRFAPRPDAADAHADNDLKSSPTTERLLEHPREEACEACYWFGGVGLMIESPSAKLRFQGAQQFEVVAPKGERVAEFASRWFDYIRDVCPARFLELHSYLELPLRIIVDSAPPEHSGLGAGTQLALSIGQGLSRYFLAMDLSPEELARSVGRGLRSAVGTHGFMRGGLIVDRGKPRENALGILDGAFQLPEAWQVVLLMSRDTMGIHGQRELNAFKNLPPIPNSITQRLQELTRQAIVPAALSGDFHLFSQAVSEYGLAAGHCFSKIQGGPFASKRAEQWIEQLRSWQVQGVGQSSWGPTLFAFASDPEHAKWIQDQIGKHADAATEYCEVTRPQRHGYLVEPT